MGHLQFRAKKFVKHVQLFMDSMQLINTQKSVLVAVSGGVDSIALLYVLSAIFKGNVRVLHFNHGTRPSTLDEEKLVIKHCEFLGLEVDIVRFDLNLEQKNFEAVARNFRLQVYKQYIEKNYWVHTGHHLDDSFEWSMIQSFKQSSLSSTLGIPVFNQGLVRPFMCASKKQIKSFAKALNLTWAQDSSNDDRRFERNFFRATLTEVIAKRYPQYLCHYVARQNQLALHLNLHRSQVNQKIKGDRSSSLLYEERELSGAVILRSWDFHFHKNKIKEWIHFFSKNHRGEIDREVDKLIMAHKKIVSDPRELKIKGPMKFSGGVTIFLLDDYLLIGNEEQLDYYRQCDELFLKLLEETDFVAHVTNLSLKASLEASLKNSLKNSKKMFFPYLCLLDSKNLSESSKLTHPLLPKSIEWLKSKKVPYSFYPLILKKGKEKLLHTAVILDSSILGL